MDNINQGLGSFEMLTKMCPGTYYTMAKLKDMCCQLKPHLNVHQFFLTAPRSEPNLEHARQMFCKWATAQLWVSPDALVLLSPLKQSSYCPVISEVSHFLQTENSFHSWGNRVPETTRFAWSQLSVATCDVGLSALPYWISILSRPRHHHLS